MSASRLLSVYHSLILATIYSAQTWYCEKSSLKLVNLWSFPQIAAPLKFKRSVLYNRVSGGHFVMETADCALIVCEAI